MSSFEDVPIGCLIFLVIPALFAFPLIIAWNITDGGNVQSVAETHARQWDGVEKVVCAGVNGKGHVKCVAYTSESEHHFSCSGFWGECYDNPR